MSEFKSDTERKRDQIMAEVPALMDLLANLRGGLGRDPIGVVLPEYMNPGRYEGEDATEVGAQLMGLPVTWGTQVGLIVAPSRWDAARKSAQ